MKLFVLVEPWLITYIRVVGNKGKGVDKAWWDVKLALGWSGGAVMGQHRYAYDFRLLYYDEYVMILTCFNLWLSLVCKTYKSSKSDNLLATFVYEVFPRKWGLRKKKRLWLRQGLPRLKWIFKRRIFKPQLIKNKKKIHSDFSKKLSLIFCNWVLGKPGHHRRCSCK